MTTVKKGEPGRDEKVEEILAILGELYQRFGVNQAGAVAATADYKFVGYRPYQAADPHGWPREPVNAMAPWLGGMAGTPTENPSHAPYYRL
ncbi:MAG: hypothetical protein HYY16_14675 [Planctomycetes bacterium]|nr:hypothetical protein [Planctomycetota bacterium]